MTNAQLVPSVEALSLLEKAVLAQAQGQSEQAIALFNQVVERVPSYAEGWFQLGVLHQDRGRYHPAMAAFETCLKIRPNSEWAHFRMGVLYSTLNRKLAALSAFQRALEAGPGFGEIRINLGAALAALGWWDAARRVLLPMDEVLKGWWASTRETALSRWNSEHSRAMALLKKRREGPYDRAALAFHLLSLGKFGAVASISRAWRSEQPNDFSPVRLHAWLLVRTEGLASALAFLSSRADDFKTVAPFHNLHSELLYENGAYDAALEAVQQDEALTGQGFDRRRKALLYFLADRWSDLLELCLTWMKRTEDTTPYRLALAAHRGTGRIGLVEESINANCAPEEWHRVIQFWDQPDPPADVRTVIGTWSKTHPDLPCILFDEARARAFVLGTHGYRALAAFDACHHPAMKADFFRVAYLYRHGGIYVDADDSCARAITPIITALDQAMLVASLSNDVMPYVHNWFIAARPNSSILRAAMEEMINIIERDRKNNRKSNIWTVTGPGLLTRAIARNLSSEVPEDVVLLDERYFRTFVKTHDTLTYKTTVEGNWRLANN